MLTASIVNDPAVLAARESEWWSLLGRSASDEPTLSPDWLLTWWQVFGGGPERTMHVVFFEERGRIVGMVPLLLRRTRDAFGSLRRLEMMASGEAEADEICSEFIGPVVERGAEEAVAEALAAALVDGAGWPPWDELVLDAMNGASSIPLLLDRELGRVGLHHTVEVSGGAPYVPLPPDWESYLEALPSSRRYTVRRSVRDLESWAGSSLQLHQARTREELDQGLEVLMQLHAERWSAAGHDGAFASTKFTAFHREIMPRLLARNALELSWLVAHGKPVAVAYNLVWNNKVYFYQGGRAMDLPQRLRPGLVLHAYAIRSAIEAKRREYDFLAGLARYKIQLALAVRPLIRLRVWIPSVRGALRRVGEVVWRQLRAARIRAADAG